MNGGDGCWRGAIDAALAASYITLLTFFSNPSPGTTTLMARVLLVPIYQLKESLAYCEYRPNPHSMYLDSLQVPR